MFASSRLELFSSVYFIEKLSKTMSNYELLIYRPPT